MTYEEAKNDKNYIISELNKRRMCPCAWCKDMYCQANFSDCKDKDFVISEAINALEKQITKKPKCYEDKFIHCPSCGIGFGYKWECYPTKVNDYSHIQYCYGCGQKLIWGNEE